MSTQYFTFFKNICASMRPAHPCTLVDCGFQINYARMSKKTGGLYVRGFYLFMGF